MVAPYETGEPRHLFTATDVIKLSLMLLQRRVRAL